MAYRETPEYLGTMSTEDAIEEIFFNHFIVENKKIWALRRYRELTGCTLKQAKNVTEAVCRSHLGDLYDY